MKNLQSLLILTAALATTLWGCDDASSDPVESTAGAAAGKSDDASACTDEDIAFLTDAANAAEEAQGPQSRVHIDRDEWDRVVADEALPASCAAAAVLGAAAETDDADKAVDSSGNICGGCWCDGEVCWEETGNIICDEGWCSCDYLLNDCV